MKTLLPGEININPYSNFWHLIEKYRDTFLDPIGSLVRVRFQKVWLDFSIQILIKFNFGS